VNTVAGRIIVKESGAGVPDLLVVLFDFDPAAHPEEVIAGAEPFGGPGGSSAPSIAIVVSTPPGADRLASVLTDANGRFEITYEDDAFNVGTANERRPDLLLFVLAPEEPGKKFEDRILYTSILIINK
jgi:hypothetical protein